MTTNNNVIQHEVHDKMEDNFTCIDTISTKTVLVISIPKITGTYKYNEFTKLNNTTTTITPSSLSTVAAATTTEQHEQLPYKLTSTKEEDCN